MDYEVLVSRKVEKFLTKVRQQDYDRIRVAIRSLGRSPRPQRCRKLRDIEGYRIRVGDYRILYTVADDEAVVRVYRVGDRKDVYR